MSTPTSLSQSNTNGAQTTQWIRSIVYTALFAAFFIAASYIKFTPGFSTVPFTLQSFAIMLAGGFLGATYGFWSITLVVLLTAAGLPLMGDGAGWAKISGATGGFIWMFPFAALLIGWASDRLFAKRKKLALPQLAILLVAVFAFGSLLLYVTGVPWLAHFSPKLNFQGALDAGMYPYLPGDAIKAVAATLVIAALRPVLPPLRPRRSRSN